VLETALFLSFDEREKEILESKYELNGFKYLDNDQTGMSSQRGKGRILDRMFIT